MIKIYLDNTLLDEDNYISFTVNKKMFDNTFYLGSTPSVEASLTIPSDALPSSITEVEVREDTEVLFNFVVDEITINDDAEAEIKLVDKMILLQKQYDFSQYVPITAKNLLIKICDDFGITYNYTSFTNEDLEINSYDNTLTENLIKMYYIKLDELIKIKDSFNDINYSTIYSFLNRYFTTYNKKLLQ